MHTNHNCALYFGDLHFHTHYSDNKDRASIEEMILAGTRHQLSIFGTADHNHNLNAEKWRRTQVESAHLRAKYPDVVLLNNCEITFLIGHFNVLVPERIEGTVAEGYRYLYLDSNALKIINHPFEFNDEWHKRIIPDAIGVEVINGNIFRHAQDKGFRFSSAIQIPSIQVYATYLALNFPVAAIGGSDAHRKAELGYGMTGFRLDSKPDTQAVITAIREYRTFATTLCGIALDWSFDAETGVISWHIDWNKENSALDNGVTIEIYCGDQKVRTASDGDGTFCVKQAGLYWIAVFDACDIAVSSPIKVGEKEEVQENHESILNTAIHYIRQDLTWLSMDEQLLSQPIAAVFSQHVEIPVIASVDFPHIVDRHGRTLPYEVIRRSSPRVIIDKECDVRGFDEFYIWLTRNELHEYVFADIEYRKVGQTFFFNGRLLPKKMAHCEHIDARYRDDMKKIRGLLDEQTRCKVYVDTLTALLVKIQFDGSRLPYRVCDVFAGIDSVFVYAEEDAECPAHILDRVKEIWPAWRSRDDAGKTLQKRIYQIFVCAESEYDTI